MIIATKRWYTAAGNLHTRHTLHHSRTRWFIQAWSVLRSCHGQTETVSEQDAREFCATAGDWKFHCDGGAYADDVRPVPFPN